MKKLKSLLIIFLMIVCNFNICFGFSENYTWSVLDPSITASTPLTEPEQVLDNNSLNLEAGAAILIEQNSGQILYGYNVHERLHPASVTKVMSLLLIMEALDSGKITLDTQIPCSTNAASMGGSQIWLDTRETLNVNDMLKAIAVVSANDCVVALAEYETLIGLARVIRSDLATPMPTEIKTIQGNASEYKKCKNAGGGYFPFGDKTALRVFDERVKNEYVDTLRKMCRFVDDFIDAGGDIKKDELLVKALVELISLDNCIDDSQSFYIKEDGTTAQKKELINMKEIPLQSFSRLQLCLDRVYQRGL